MAYTFKRSDKLWLCINAQYRTLFVMEAGKDGAPAKPAQSNTEEVLCQPGPTSTLPTEIE